jgi:hypothetical protein
MFGNAMRTIKGGVYGRAGAPNPNGMAFEQLYSTFGQNIEN